MEQEKIYLLILSVYLIIGIIIIFIAETKKREENIKEYEKKIF